MLHCTTAVSINSFHNLSLSHCLFSHSYIAVFIRNSFNLLITHSQIINGDNDGTTASSFRVIDSNNVRVYSSSFNNNHDIYGRLVGIATHFERSEGFFFNCEFINNTQQLYGIVGVVDDSNVHFINSTFSKNQFMASSGGGAVYVSSSSSSFINCNFNNNSAGNGGAAFVVNSEVTINNCRFNNNAATEGILTKKKRKRKNKKNKKTKKRIGIRKRIRIKINTKE